MCTVGEVNGADTPRSLSRALASTVYAPQAGNDTANPFAPNAPKPLPASKAQLKPALVSAVDGSIAIPVNVTPCPTRPFSGLAARAVTVGATIATMTVDCAVDVRPSSSVTRTFTTGDDGPSSAEKDTLCPDVSNVPLSSRSQANENAPPSGSAPVAVSVTVEPSSTAYGPPAEADGGSVSSTRTTDGSWSDA